jgi:hypothetical protein
MVKRVFIVHGWQATPHVNWFPWLKFELEEKGIEAYVPQLPDTDTPKMDAWIGALSRLIGKPDSDTYLIGHSLGCIAILRYLESLGGRDRVGGAVLVAGFTDDLGESALSDFYRTQIGWGRIRLCCSNFVALTSDDDPWVPLRYGDILREKLGAKLVVEHGMGHFNMSDLPMALDAVMEMTGVKK